ncbi:hypothetical protein PLESTF_001092600 [Pleodorina starrii]|nr:hypothetical protein PLESTM_002058200 [Pleodorina starrii]GLC71231.1 hypothetical protein PLESTF_001092600 [Pleodorina starrii]
MLRGRGELLMVVGLGVLTGWYIFGEPLQTASMRLHQQQEIQQQPQQPQQQQKPQPQAAAAAAAAK